MRLQVAYQIVLFCLKRSEDPRLKSDISGFIWHKISHSNGEIFSFFNERIVYQSFYGALLTLSYFFFQEKFCV